MTMHPKTVFDSLAIAALLAIAILVNSPLMNWENKNPSDIFALRTGTSLVIMLLSAFHGFEIYNHDEENC
jgi:hypothetical protein